MSWLGLSRVGFIAIRRAVLTLAASGVFVGSSLSLLFFFRCLLFFFSHMTCVLVDLHQQNVDLRRPRMLDGAANAPVC